MSIRYIAQDDHSGDLYISAALLLHRITYTKRTVSLVSGSPGSNAGYRDSTLLNSVFNQPLDPIFVGSQTLLVADGNNYKLRLLDMNSDKVTTLNFSDPLHSPVSLMITNNTLYVGHYRQITQYKCEYHITYYLCEI